MAPEFVEPPDVVCQLGGNHYGLAVKRLQSLDRFEERFSKCCKQIENSKIPGYAVMDLSLAVNPGNRPISASIDDHDMHGLTSKWCQETFVPKHEWMKKTQRGREVRGLIILLHFIKYVPKEGIWGLYSYTWGYSLSPDNQKRRREFSAFFNRFVKGLATPASQGL